jgi:hypothetical protein
VARAPRPEPSSDLAQIEALFREAEVQRESTDTRNDEPTSEKPDRGDRESSPDKPPEGNPIPVVCSSQPKICNLFTPAFQLPGTIPVAVGSTEAIYIPFGDGGEVWVRTPDILWRYPTPAMTSPGEVAKFVEKVL